MTIVCIQACWIQIRSSIRSMVDVPECHSWSENCTAAGTLCASVKLFQVAAFQMVTFLGCCSKKYGHEACLPYMPLLASFPCQTASSLQTCFQACPCPYPYPCQACPYPCPCQACPYPCPCRASPCPYRPSPSPFRRHHHLLLYHRRLSLHLPAGFDKISAQTQKLETQWPLSCDITWYHFKPRPFLPPFLIHGGNGCPIPSPPVKRMLE